MKKLLILFFVICVGFNNCSKNKSLQKYSVDKNGNYYQLLAIGDLKTNPNSENILLLSAELKTQNDSVFFNTEHSTKNGLVIYLNNPLVQTYFSNYFLKLVEGDSASFLIPPPLFFKCFFDSSVPKFSMKDSIVKMNFKIKSVLSHNSYQTLIRKEIEDKELVELKEIDTYLKINYPSVTPNSYGIYQLEKKENNSVKVELGNKITVNYQGFFLDGKPLDSSPQQLEYIYGTPDQFVKGLNIVIGTLKKGEFSKIIVPSRLAFGELGSSNQQVQPYTPLVYKITLIDIK